MQKQKISMSGVLLRNRVMDKTYAVLSDYNERGATLHIKAYGQDIASFWLRRDALLDLSREIRKSDVLLGTR